MKRYITACMMLVALAASPVLALPPLPVRTLENAVDVLDDLATIPAKSIPPALLADAQGVAIIPNVVKAGFIFGGRAGHGVVLVRLRDGTWSEPIFVNLGGASVGFQIGVESTDVVLVFRHRKSLDRILDGKGKITLGGDVSVAAGPVGRTASASTDAKLEAEIVSYSRSRGLFAGVSLDGATILPAPEANGIFRKGWPAEEKKLADVLRGRLIEMSSAKLIEPKPTLLLPPSPVPPPPPVLPPPPLPVKP